MTDMHRTPRFNDVVREQIRATALSLRVPAIVAGLLATLATLLAVADFMRGRGGVEFAPELSLIPAFAGTLLPVGVWLSEKRFGPGLFWTFPVDRARHALAKVFAGWIILMAAVTAFVLWLLILALITKGNIVGDEVIKLLPSYDIPASGTLDPSMLRTITWIPPRVLWLTPFFAATGMYAIASALMLGLRHPFKVIIGVIAACFIGALISQGMETDAGDAAAGGVLQAVLFSKYGLDGLLSAHAESLKTVVKLSNGQMASVWRGLPVISEWIIASALWTGLGLAGLFAAIMRHRERR